MCNPALGIAHCSLLIAHWSQGNGRSDGPKLGSFVHLLGGTKRLGPRNEPSFVANFVANFVDPAHRRGSFRQSFRQSWDTSTATLNTYDACRHARHIQSPRPSTAHRRSVLIRR